MLQEVKQKNNKKTEQILVITERKTGKEQFTLYPFKLFNCNG